MAPRHDMNTLRWLNVAMLTFEQMLIGGGLLALAFALLYGLALKGGHGTRRR
jgi:hypothetical protein